VHPLSPPGILSLCCSSTEVYQFLMPAILLLFNLIVAAAPRHPLSSSTLCTCQHFSSPCLPSTFAPHYFRFGRPAGSSGTSFAPHYFWFGCPAGVHPDLWEVDGILDDLMVVLLLDALFLGFARRSIMFSPTSTIAPPQKLCSFVDAVVCHARRWACR